MRVVIYRIYHSPEGVKRFLQGKVFRPKNYKFDIYYRDIYPKRSTLWKTRYEKPESESLNIDHLVFEWILKQEIKEIHYYIVPRRQLLRIETAKVERHIERGNVKKEMLNNHTQYFIPKDLFNRSKRDYSVPWINGEVNINDLLREKDEELANSQLIPDEVKLKFYQAYKQIALKQKTKPVISSQQLSIV
jgi:hypothetical protein